MITDKKGNILKEPYLSMAKDPILNGKFTFCGDSTDLKERFTFKRTTEGKSFWKKVYNGGSPNIDMKIMTNYNHIFGKENKDINEYLSKCFSKESGEFSFHGNFLQVKSIAFTICNYVKDDRFIEFPKSFDNLRTIHNGYKNHMSDQILKAIEFNGSKYRKYDIYKKAKNWEFAPTKYRREGHYTKPSLLFLDHQSHLLNTFNYILKVSFYKDNGEVKVFFELNSCYTDEDDNYDDIKIISYNSTPFTTFFKLTYNDINYYGNPLSGFYDYNNIQKLDTTQILNQNYNISSIDSFKLLKKDNIHFFDNEDYYVITRYLMNKYNRWESRGLDGFLLISKKNGLSFKVNDNIATEDGGVPFDYSCTSIEFKNKKAKIIKEEDKWNILLNPSIIKQIMKYKLPSLVK